MSTPRVTIITINYNNLKGLQETVSSVLKQRKASYEYLIVDGASSDGSADYLRRISDQVTNIISETDDGVYEAMNKGITQASGEYLLFLNSGDWLDSNRTLQMFLKERLDAHIVYGDLVIHRGDEEFVRSYPNEIDLLYLTRDTLPHPATFIRKEVFEMLGNYDESLRIVADWALFLKAALHPKITFGKIAQPISHFTMDGISSKPESAKVIKEEKEKVMEDVLPKSVRTLLSDHRHLKREYNAIRSNRLVKIVLGITGLKNRIMGS